MWHGLNTAFPKFTTPIEDDPWLDGLRKSALDLGDIYTTAIFVGAWYRHHKGDVVARVENMLTGGSDGHTDKLRQWARGLPEDIAGDLLQMILSELDQIEQSLRDALENFDGESETWRRALVGMAERRDALGDAISVLGMRGEAGWLGETLTAFDRMGDRLVVSAPWVAEVDESERLHRVAPSVWWARLNPKNVWV